MPGTLRQRGIPQRGTGWPGARHEDRGLAGRSIGRRLPPHRTLHAPGLGPEVPPHNTRR